MKKLQRRTSLFAASALFVSIAVHLQAAVFNSASTGPWSNPASWTPPGASPYPNTYGADSAIIGAGHIISYDGLGTTFPFDTLLNYGNLTVANGNSITINGGTLNQTWAPGTPPPTGTAIAIGVTGSADGTGILNINAGGTFDSGTADAVAVGVTLSALNPPYASTGNGMVNVNEGTFFMGAGSNAGNGLAIGIDHGAIGVFNLGDGLPGAAMLDVKTNNSLVTIGGRSSADTVGGMGEMTIKSDGTLLAGSRTITVGDIGGKGTLTIDLNGHLTGIGTASPGVGGVTGGNLIIGTGVDTQAVPVSSIGNMVSRGIVTGIGTFTVGTDGAVGVGPLAGGTATIAAGSFNAQTTYVGRNGGVGVLNVTGGSFTTGEDRRDGGSRGLRIGVDGAGSNGTLNISGGGVVHQTGWLDVGLGAGNVGKINISGAGSKFSHEDLGDNNDSSIGRDGGTGELHITAGGEFITNFWLNAARGAGSTSVITVDGAGSKLTQTNATGKNPHFNIGENGNGRLTATNGAAVKGWEMWVAGDDNNGGATGKVDIKSGSTLSLNHWLAIGNNAGSDGEVNVDGAGSKLTILPNAADRGDTQIGYKGGTGRLNVTNGGNFSTSWWINIGRGAGSTGTVKVDGAGSTILQGTIAGDMRTNVGENGIGRLEITNGGKFQKFAGSETAIGREGGSDGTVIIDGANSLFHQRSGDIFIGTRGKGTMTVSNGGELRVNTGGVGVVQVGTWNGDPNASGTLDVNGGTVAGLRDPEIPDYNAESGARLTIGNESTTSGTVRITNGGTVSFLSVTVGNQGQGTINQDSGTLNVGQWLEIGQDRNGDVASDVGLGIRGNEATYNLLGGTLNTRQLLVGSRRKGLLEMSGGTVNMGSNGTTTIDTGSFAVGFFGAPDGSHGDGVLHQTGGVINSYGKNLQIGAQAGTIGVYNFDKGTLNMNPALTPEAEANPFPGLRNIVVGDNGTGTLNVAVAGGLPSADPVVTGIENFNVAANGGSKGTLNVNFNNPASVLLSREFFSGNGGGAIGETNIKSGILQTNGWVEVGRNGGTGIVNVDGPTAVWNRGTGPGGYTADMQVGYNGGTGKINILNGGTMNTNWWLNIARRADSTGEVNVDGAGSTLNQSNGFMNVGEQGTGRLNVTNGGKVDAWELYVGRDGGSSGAVSVLSGGTLHSNNWTQIGTGGSGSVDVADPGSNFRAIRDVRIGGGGQTGSVSFKNGGTGNFSGYVELGGGGGATGTILVEGAGSILSSATSGGGDMQVGINGGTGIVNVINGGTLNHNWWINIARGGGSTGTVLVDGVGSTINQSGGPVNVGEDGSGILTVKNSGRLTTSDQLIVGRNGGSTGIVSVETGGVITADSIVASGGGASLTLKGGTLRPNQTENDFIQGFTNTGVHSAIKLEGSGGTIDTNGFNVRIKAANVFSSPDVLVDGLAGTVLTKAGAGTLAFEPNLGGGFISVHVTGGTLSQQGSSTLDALVIDGGTTYIIDAPGTPPPAVPGFAPEVLAASFDPAGGGGGHASASPMQGVPEPGTISLLLLSGLGLLGRRQREKKA